MENSFFAEIESILESGLPVEVQRAKLRDLAPDDVLVDTLTLVIQTARRLARSRSEVAAAAREACVLRELVDGGDAA